MAKNAKKCNLGSIWYEDNKIHIGEYTLQTPSSIDGVNWKNDHDGSVAMLVMFKDKVLTLMMHEAGDFSCEQEKGNKFVFDHGIVKVKENVLELGKTKFDLGKSYDQVDYHREKDELIFCVVCGNEVFSIKLLEADLGKDKVPYKARTYLLNDSTQDSGKLLKIFVQKEASFFFTERVVKAIDKYTYKRSDVILFPCEAGIADQTLFVEKTVYEPNDPDPKIRKYLVFRIGTVCVVLDTIHKRIVRFRHNSCFLSGVNRINSCDSEEDLFQIETLDEQKLICKYNPLLDEVIEESQQGFWISEVACGFYKKTSSGRKPYNPKKKKIAITFTEWNQRVCVEFFKSEKNVPSLDGNEIVSPWGRQLTVKNKDSRLFVENAEIIIETQGGPTTYKKGMYLVQITQEKDLSTVFFVSPGVWEVFTYPEDKSVLFADFNMMTSKVINGDVVYTDDACYLDPELMPQIENGRHSLTPFYYFFTIHAFGRDVPQLGSYLDEDEMEEESESYERKYNYKVYYDTLEKKKFGIYNALTNELLYMVERGNIQPVDYQVQMV